MVTIKSKAFISIIPIVFSVLLVSPVFAQNQKDSLPKADDFFNQWLDYSRPGKYHQLLADLAGTWTFQGRHYTGNPNPDSNRVEIEFTGTIERKSFANGRYFIVDVTGGKIQMPIQDGKMEDANAKEIITEGYDNIKQKFVQATISNHLGSDLHYSEGDYDSTTKTIIYQHVEALIPSVKMKTYEHLKILDSDHYTTEVYRERYNTIIKDTEINYTRVKGK